MPRHFLLAVLLTTVSALQGQSLAGDSTAAVSHSRAVSVPLNAVKLFDRALEAWTWTYGQEPGAQLLRSNREEGIIEGTARVNFRSEMLNNREETMGTIQYRVIIQVKAGECRTVITELTHSGNRNAPRNGIHVGLITRSVVPPGRLPGMGRTNAVRLYAEIKDTANSRITALMQAFESRLRAGVEP